MSEERIGDKFLRKLYEKTVNNGTKILIEGKLEMKSE